MKPFRIYGLLVLLTTNIWTMAWMGCKKQSTPKTKSKITAPQTTKTPASKTDHDARWKKKGKQIARKAFAALSSQLMKAMQKGGIPKAIPFCSLQAGPLTKQVADAQKVQLARISHKARNPKNQASPKEFALIQVYQAQLKAKTPLQPTLQKTAEHVVFYAPILLGMPTCLRCHGTPGKELKDEHLKLIQKHYPKDQATGFRLGELRGLWKITFPKQG